VARKGCSAELADPSDGLIDGMAAGDLDVVDDGAVPEPDQPVAAGGDLRVMGGDDNRHLVLAAQPGRQAENCGAATGVQVAGRLVGEKQRRGVDQRPGDGGPLLLGQTRELAVRLSQPVRQAGPVTGQPGPLSAPDRVRHE
jgi:hypothetical protein